MDYLLGIDLGSTNLKAVVYDVNGRAVASGSRPTLRFNPSAEHPDWAIWKPEQIWDSVAESIREALSAVPQPANIRGVTVTGMGMDGLPMTEDGNWLYPFISWHCPRTLPQQRWWIEHIGADRQFSLTGTPIWGFNTALRLLWMKEHEPEILARAHKWVLIEDFVNYQLCGRFATDYSMASTTLLFDQRQRRWSEELIAASGVDGRLLCEALPSGTILGEVHGRASAATGLAKGTPVVLGGHDYCCGMLPTGAFVPGVVLDVTGTWEMVVTALDAPILDPAVGRLGVFVDSHVARGKWTVMGGAVAADMLEWFRREFGSDERRKAEEQGGSDWTHLMAAAASSPPGSRGVLFLPHMSGASCPVVDPTSMGALVGLRNFVTKSDIQRAVIEGLDYQFLDIIEAYRRGLSVSPERIVAIGGATNNEFWMQNKADVVGKPIEVPALDEAVPLGAAILAGIGSGVYRDEAEAFATVRRPGRVYEPDPALSSRYRESYETWSALYTAIRPVHTQLHSQPAGH